MAQMQEFKKIFFSDTKNENFVFIIFFYSKGRYKVSIDIINFFLTS